VFIFLRALTELQSRELLSEFFAQTGTEIFNENRVDKGLAQVLDGFHEGQAEGLIRTAFQEGLQKNIHEFCFVSHFFFFLPFFGLGYFVCNFL
jgi:hypothetical protein